MRRLWVQTSPGALFVFYYNFESHCLHIRSNPKSGWPSGLRRQTQVDQLQWFLPLRAFWSTNVGVGSNPTPDTYFYFFFYWKKAILVKRTLRQRGIEPRSTAWKATMLTITPLTPLIPSQFCQMVILHWSLKANLHIASFPHLFCQNIYFWQ